MTSTPDRFSPDILHAALQAMPACESALVALSGGLDSVVLLHALVQLKNQNRLPLQLRAMHVNHGLHADANQWQEHCATLCREWGVAFVCTGLDLTEAVCTGAGIENAARNGRYEAFTAQLAGNEALLLAHHRDDQMETQLLRLMRGAGPGGLAGMPQLRNLGQGFLYRPLLSCDRQALLDYGRQQQLRWIDDPSNLAQEFDRNYCRHTLLPLIAARWPAWSSSWSKSAALQSEADELLQELAAIDLQLLRGDAANELVLDALMHLSKPRQRNVLRHWLQQFAVPEPGWHDLRQLTEAVLPAAADAQACWLRAGHMVTRFGNRLLLLRTPDRIDPALRLSWNPVEQPQFALPGNGLLLARPGSGNAEERKLELSVSGEVQVRYRQGGESCRLPGRPERPLKKILQEHQLAPWYRERLPLLYVEDQLRYVPGIGPAIHTMTSPPTTTSTPRPMLVIEWQAPDWTPALK